MRREVADLLITVLKYFILNKLLVETQAHEPFPLCCWVLKSVSSEFNRTVLLGREIRGKTEEAFLFSPQ